MSEIFKINIPNVTHVLGVSAISRKKQSRCLGKCPKNMRNFRSVHKQMMCLMSELSEINMPSVIHVLGVSGVSDENSPGARVKSEKKCGTSGASGECAKINELLNVQNIRNRYTKCNACPESVRNIQNKTTLVLG